MFSLARAVARKRYGIDPAELRFHLVEAAGRILPEVSRSVSGWVAKRLTHKGATVHLGTTVTSVCDGVVELSTGERFESGLIVWTAGIAANPVIAKRTDLPTNERGLIVVRPDLQVGTRAAPLPGAWAAGDAAAVPDLAVGGSALTVPNAQHAVRQGKRLAKNLVAVIRGRCTQPYRHGSLGVIATLGLGDGVFESGPIVLKGFPGVARAPRLPRAGDPDLGAEAAGAGRVGVGRLPRPRHRLAALGPAAGLRVQARGPGLVPRHAPP
ncbi:FAD-dependent oxidoreductase [Nocardioides sp. CER19]|uniref:NAD(P)/FAD-dependent oxidoreductase n=1 Tax=Nocardioides sp. CER19 TaxID=3038538 RepID=UPI00244D18CC|nr:FAD-dependent oxidoreductase [Nocardioides sp. CER19]MDH2415268.1 FAD-dependent oxidoreductase [Nocardioides sp. CER19]